MREGDGGVNGIPCACVPSSDKYPLSLSFLHPPPYLIPRFLVFNPEARLSAEEVCVLVRVLVCGDV